MPNSSEYCTPQAQTSPWIQTGHRTRTAQCKPCWYVIYHAFMRHSFKFLSNLDQTSKAIWGEGEITKSRLSVKFKNSIYTVYERKWHEVENQRSSQCLQVTRFKASTQIQATCLSLPTDYFCTFVRAKGNAFLMNKTKSHMRERARVWEVPDAVSKSLWPHQESWSHLSLLRLSGSYVS